MDIYFTQEEKMPRGSKHQFEEDLMRELSNIKEQLAQRPTNQRTIGEDIMKGIGDIKDYLAQILDKLSQLDETIHQTKVKETNEQVSDTIQIMKDTADSLKNLEEIFHQRSQDVDPTILIDSTELSFKREAERIKQSIIQKWNQCLTQRRIQFWNMIKNKNKADIYLGWL